MDMLIADDHALYRQLLRPLLAEVYPDASITEAESYPQLRSACTRRRPRLLILDVCMPGMHGLADARKIIRQFPGMRVLICSAIDNPILVRTMLAFGARGYVSKAMPARHLLAGIDTVLNGGRYMPPGMPRDDAGAQLTDRQWEILGMVCMGLSNKEIAERLGLSIRTVKFHVGLVLKALGVPSRQQAMVSCGLIS